MYIHVYNMYIKQTHMQHAHKQTYKHIKQTHMQHAHKQTHMEHAHKQTHMQHAYKHMQTCIHIHKHTHAHTHTQHTYIHTSTHMHILYTQHAYTHIHKKNILETRGWGLAAEGRGSSLSRMLEFFYNNISTNHSRGQMSKVI